MAGGRLLGQTISRPDRHREPSIDPTDKPAAFGVFKPVGHVIVSFPPGADVQGAVDELRSSGYTGEALLFYTPEQMKRQAEIDIDEAGLLASIGQELNLVKAHRDLAEQGHSFIIVKAPSDEQAAQVADCARRHDATRAQKYGRFLIEELIMVGDDRRQVAESPDRGLDAQNLSGREGDDSGR